MYLIHGLPRETSLYSLVLRARAWERVSARGRREDARSRGRKEDAPRLDNAHNVVDAHLGDREVVPRRKADDVALAARVLGPEQARDGRVVVGGRRRGDLVGEEGGKVVLEDEGAVVLGGEGAAGALVARAQVALGVVRREGRELRRLDGSLPGALGAVRCERGESVSMCAFRPEESAARGRRASWRRASARRTGLPRRPGDDDIRTASPARRGSTGPQRRPCSTPSSCVHRPRGGRGRELSSPNRLLSRSKEYPARSPPSPAACACPASTQGPQLPAHAVSRAARLAPLHRVTRVERRRRERTHGCTGPIPA